MVSLDNLLQKTGGLYSPSVFTLNHADSTGDDQTSVDDIFACPKTGVPLTRDGDYMVNGDARYEIRDGIYVFKELD
jgi:hypothetical protein